MNALIQAVTVLLPTAYLATAVLYGMAFGGDRAPPFAESWRPRVLGATLGLHLALFAAHWAVATTFPVHGAWLMVSAATLVTALLYTLLTARIGRPAVGGIVFGMCALLQSAASSLGPVRAVPRDPADAVMVLHVATVALAAAALVLSGLFGYLHLLLLRQMRAKRFGPVYRQLPDLEQLARLTRRAALAGFLFLTAGLNVGIGLAHQRVKEFHYLEPSVLLTMAVWVHFGLIAFSRHIRGWTARRASLAAVIGLVTLLVTILLTFIPTTPFHGRG